MLRRVVMAGFLGAALAYASAGQAADIGSSYTYGGDGFAAAPATSWGGTYVGALAGFGFGRASGASTNGALGGVTTGFNWQSGQVVLGAEGDIAYTGIGFSGFNERFDAQWLATARLRGGYAAGSTLFYGTAGVGVTRAKYAVRAVGSDRNMHTGIAYGVGAEHRLSNELSVKADLMRVDFGRKNYDVGAGVSIRPSVNTLRAGINYRF